MEDTGHGTGVSADNGVGSMDQLAQPVTAAGPPEGGHGRGTSPRKDTKRRSRPSCLPKVLTSYFARFLPARLQDQDAEIDGSGDPPERQKSDQEKKKKEIEEEEAIFKEAEEEIMDGKYGNSLDSQAESVAERGDRIAELVFFVGSTIALLVLLSNGVYQQPASDAVDVLSNAYGAWCGDFLQTCASLLSNPPNLLCALQDDHDRFPYSAPSIASTYLQSEMSTVGVDIPNVPDNLTSMTGSRLFSAIYTCQESPVGRLLATSPEALGCQINATAILPFVEFASGNTTLTYAELQCLSSTNWLVNSAYDYVLFVRVCQFTALPYVYIALASFIVLLIACIHVVHAWINAVLKHNGKKHSKEKIFNQLRLAIALQFLATFSYMAIGVGGIVQVASYPNCFVGNSYISMLSFSIVIVLCGFVFLGFGGFNYTRSARTFISTYYEILKKIDEKTGDKGPRRNV